MMMCEGSGVAGDRNEKPGRLQVFGDARGQAGGGGLGWEIEGGGSHGWREGYKNGHEKERGGGGQVEPGSHSLWGFEGGDDA